MTTRCEGTKDPTLEILPEGLITSGCGCAIELVTDARRICNRKALEATGAAMATCGGKRNFTHARRKRGKLQVGVLLPSRMDAGQEARPGALTPTRGCPAEGMLGRKLAQVLWRFGPEGGLSSRRDAGQEARPGALAPMVGATVLKHRWDPGQVSRPGTLASTVGCPAEGCWAGRSPRCFGPEDGPPSRRDAGQEARPGALVFWPTRWAAQQNGCWAGRSPRALAPKVGATVLRHRWDPGQEARPGALAPRCLGPEGGLPSRGMLGRLLAWCFDPEGGRHCAVTRTRCGGQQPAGSACMTSLLGSLLRHSAHSGPASGRSGVWVAQPCRRVSLRRQCEQS